MGKCNAERGVRGAGGRAVRVAGRSVTPGGPQRLCGVRLQALTGDLIVHSGEAASASIIPQKPVGVVKICNEQIDVTISIKVTPDNILRIVSDVAAHQ